MYLSSERCLTLSSSTTKAKTLQTTQHEASGMCKSLCLFLHDLIFLILGFIYFFVGPQVYKYDYAQKHVVGVETANSWLGCWNSVNPWTCNKHITWKHKTTRRNKHRFGHCHNFFLFWAKFYLSVLIFCQNKEFEPDIMCVVSEHTPT